MNEKKYRVLDEFMDAFYWGEQTEDVEKRQRTGWTPDELTDLARGWNMELDDLMRQMEEI